MLLRELTRFYKDEAAGLPHDKADLWDLGWQLAAIIEQYKIDEWKVSFDEEKRLIEMLRTTPDSALIDTAVNLLHWAVLHSQANEALLDWEKDFKALGRDVVHYLLMREVSQ